MDDQSFSPWDIVLFAIMTVLGCWSFGQIYDGWKAHDAKVALYRLENR
jgi:hypothetical protein